jgi:uncharacterized glyoxalase superfamily protein PhnB
MEFAAPVPILRMFDEHKAREFYLDYLGFEVVFEHRFEPGTPLYMGLSRGACMLHLSGHHGDCAPGAAVRIAVDDLDGFRAQLRSKPYMYARPAIEDTPWGTREMKIIDPFFNRVIFVDARSNRPSAGDAA